MNGCLATSDNFPSPKDKAETIRSADIDAIDMETSAFYHAASLFDIPALAIRSISNVLDDKGADGNVSKADIKTSDRSAALALDILENYSL